MPTTHRRHNPAAIRTRATHPVPDRRDPRATAVYNSPEWAKLRTMARAIHPMCADPYKLHEQTGISEPAVEVHHIVAIVDDPSRAYDLTNLMPVCTHCHARLDAELRRPRRQASRQHQINAGETSQTIATVTLPTAQDALQRNCDGVTKSLQ